MSSLADRTLVALRRTHDDLAAVVPTLSDDQLAGGSGASDWTVAQVLSHLGSGAEIARAGYAAALAGADIPAQDFNQTVWDHWNALTPREQAHGYLEQDAALVDFVESLSPEQRESVQIRLGFLPAPLPLAAALGMRLNEAALHAWDVRVSLDPAATLAGDTAAVLVEHFSGGLAFLLGFLSHPDAVPEPAVVRLGQAGTDLVVDQGVRLAPQAGEPTATFSGAPEAAVRLLSGRLSPQYTPAGVEVTGNVTLDDLRRVFPGF